MLRELIAPTKSNLLRTKERLAIATEGYDLLEQKREILVMELMSKLEQVKLLERDLDAKVKISYPALKKMLITVGRDRANTLTSGIEYNYDMKDKRIMAAGMQLPGLEVTLPEAALKYAPSRSFAECDEVTLEFFRILRILTELAAMRTMVWTLARELRKTQRRVNALEKIVIPTAKGTKAYIEAALEEKERDAFFSSKLLKKKAEARNNKKIVGKPQIDGQVQCKEAAR
jgi:V/A-type H+-transporting ATPase subunit D